LEIKNCPECGGDKKMFLQGYLTVKKLNFTLDANKKIIPFDSITVSPNTPFTEIIDCYDYSIRNLVYVCDNCTYREKVRTEIIVHDLKQEKLSKEVENDFDE
jgi:DNA-directed RNA polymerase subunit M/transcription elongation factor TFIIS